MRHSLRRLFEWTTARWGVTASLAVTAVLALGSQAALLLRRVVAGSFNVNPDAAIFLHAGWYVTEGAIPYVHFFDVKPPLAFETTMLFALLAGDDSRAIFFVSVAAMIVAFVGITTLAASISGRRTADPFQTLLTGLFLFTVPVFYMLPTHGFRPKYFGLLFALLAIHTGQDERWATAGVAAALAAGYWQMFLVVPLLVFGQSLRETRRAAGRVLAGGLAVAVVAVGFVVVAGGGNAMLVEVLYVPLTGSSGGSISANVVNLAANLGYATPLVLFGVVGSLFVLLSDFRPGDSWILVPLVWFTGHAVLLEVEGFGDVFALFAFTAVAVGVAAGRVAHDDSTKLLRPATIAVVSVVILLAPVWVMGPGILLNPVAFDSPSPDEAPFRSNVESLRATLSPDDGPLPPEVRGMDRSEHIKQLFWNLERPESCHYRLSGKEISWIERSGGSFDETRCGQTPQIL